MQKTICLFGYAVRKTFLIALCTGIFICCDDKESSRPAEYNPDKPVVLTSFYPQSGRVTEKVLLDGENFGSDVSKIKVYFNRKQAAVVGSTGNRMYVLVPRLPGNICNVSVVIGKDSVTYDRTFAYYSSALVTTITGNGQKPYKGGTLAEATFQARYICVDAENNIFASVRDNEFWGVVKVSEAQNSVTPMIMNTGKQDAQSFIPNALCADFATGIVTVPHDGSKEVYYTFDPREAWAPRMRTMKLKPEEAGQMTTPYKYAMAYCPYDGCLYTRYQYGQVVKINPKTYESEIIYTTLYGSGYGLAFHPLKPWLLYFSFQGNAQANAHGICTLDIRDPQAPDAFKRINAPSTAAGHRDGALETAQFNTPWQLYFDPEGYLYVADAGNHCIRRITPDDMVETVVGIPGTSGMQDGGKEDALFNTPRGVAVGLDGTVYISDYNNCRIRKLKIE
ncbi:IPT/TIG domain-containing protein [Viscerimonas tarda]